MIISLKINDPLVTKVGNVHLSPLSEEAAGQVAAQTLTTTNGTRPARGAVQGFLPTDGSARSAERGRGGGATRENAAAMAARPGPRERDVGDAEGEASHELLGQTQGTCNCPPGSRGTTLAPHKHLTCTRPTASCPGPS